jgi:hypothetical protein
MAPAKRAAETRTDFIVVVVVVVVVVVAVATGE